MQGIARRVSRSFLHRGCGHGLILSCSSEFESSVCSHAFSDSGVLFSGGVESPTFPRVRLACPSLCPAIFAISVCAGGFWAPVSGRHFSISIWVGQRPVRLQTETGSHSACGGLVGVDAAAINERTFVFRRMHHRGQRRRHLLLVLRHNPTLCSCSIQE